MVSIEFAAIQGRLGGGSPFHTNLINVCGNFSLPIAEEKSGGRSLWRDHMLALDDSQFQIAQRLAQEVWGVQIWEVTEEEEEF